MHRGLILLTATLFALLSLQQAGTARAAKTKKATSAKSGIAYKVRYEGDVAPDTLALLQAVSKAETLRESPPESILLLENRAQEDRTNFKKVFDSQGHFAATISFAVNADTKPAEVVYRIDPGPQFMLHSARMRTPDGSQATGSAIPDLATVGLTVPSPFSAKAIVDAQDKLAAYPRHHGYPYAKVTDRQVTANFANQQVDVVWTVDPGPKAFFGVTHYTGLTSVKETYLRDLIPWMPGETYDIAQLEQYRKKLSGLDLFASIQVDPETSLSADSRVPVMVKLIERKHRTIKGGVDYKTDEGPGVNLSWEHRNLFGNGEKLSLRGSASGVERLGEITFTKPDIITPKDLFKAKGLVTDENKKAYRGKNITGTVSVRHHFTDTFSAALGVGYRVTRIEADQARPWNDNTLYSFAFVPIEATLDTRNNLLDPTRGLMASVSLSPYLGTMRDSPNFIRPEATVSTYVPLAKKPGIVLALRASAGANIGASRNDVPPDLRFYAGGSGSIRGYPYQTVGPLNSKTPVGGNSVFTFSTELRIRITELIGLVPFLDGGSAFTETLPPYHQPLLLGAGLGLRIFTPIGPIRFDVATPLTRRKDIDDIAQFYFSIGQSF